MVCERRKILKARLDAKYHEGEGNGGHGAHSSIEFR